jgi:amidase
MTELFFTTACHQAQLIRTQQISPLELTQLYLDRIAQIDPQINSFFAVAADRALALAKDQTEQLQKSADVTKFPPLFGLPTAIKDLNPVAGLPCSYGVVALKEQLATADDSIATLVQQAGCNILGKTATPELGSFPYTEPAGWPPTRNPWNLEYTPGGSSGGAVAAVAAGLLPLAVGSDGGGSLRGPAHCCGLVAIKPTRGRVSDAPTGDRSSGLAINGSLARNVEDAAMLLDALAQRLPGDLYCLPAPVTSFQAAVHQDPGFLRVAVCKSFPPFTNLDPSYGAAIDRVADICSNLGHQLSTIELAVGDLVEPFTTVWQTAVAAAGIPLPALCEFNQWLHHRSGSAGEYLNALYQMQGLARQIVAQWENFDVLLSPVYLHPTLKIGAWADLAPEQIMAKIGEWISPCPVFNATGQPAIALPVETTGLPIGIQLVGNLGAEAQLISLAAQLEAQLPTVNYPRLRSTT